MDYNFIKEILKPVVSDLSADTSTLESFLAERENGFILKHNINELAKLLKFLDSPDNIFILNGFMGSGKTYTADCFLDFISEDVLIFKNSYQEAINLDDVFLSMFKDFSIYHNEKKVLLPKVETNVFTQKINSYIKYCNVPMLFIFDSFEINIRSSDTQKDILDFINFLSHFEKIKVVICSRTFKQNDLISPDSSVCAVLSSLTNDEMYEYLEQNNIKGTKYECEELYKVTRGHYLLLELAVMIMQISNLSLTLFSSEYKKSSKNFLEFLISKILSFSSDKFIKLLLILAGFRHGVSANFLKNQKIASEDDLDFLLQKHVISEKFEKFYLKDYIKNEFIKTVNTETKIRVHNFILDVYEAELPLKPFDRELFLSRLTMRQEAAYHSRRIAALEEELEKSGKSKKNNSIQELSYLTYVKNTGYRLGMENKSPAEKKYIKSGLIKNNKNLISKKETLFFNSSQDDISKKMQDISNQDTDIISDKQDLDYIVTIPDSLDEYIDIAKQYEDAFNYSAAIMYYKKALTYTNDEMFTQKEPVLYIRIAICCKKIQDTDEAIKNYEKVYQIYLHNSPDRANEILFDIARVYSDVYKFDKAKEVYKRILFSPEGVSSSMIVKIYLNLSELEDNNLDVKSAIKYAQSALSQAEKLSDTGLLCECYFKYALLLDDTNNIDLALKYYLRCVQTSNDALINPYLAAAYSNLAAISCDSKNFSAAKMYYELSIESDKKTNNFEGLYYSYSKLADIYIKENPDKTYEFLVLALSAAKKLDDITYTVSVYIEIGDYYLRTGDYKQSLKSYILALTLTPAHSADDLKDKINKKMNKIKILLGETEFIQLRNEIKKKK
ncbi:MAG: tetratricopeptide repeat protein [Candidatus Gastranaerophilales bacterium]|nr:tetratricopeptide repeat protein [Candidatus Gastranaerophilales bacterium]